MIYYDSTYLARLYLWEHGSAEVREFATARGRVTCCELGQIEVAFVFHRKLREGAINPEDHALFAEQFEEDLVRGVWNWLPVTSDLLAQVRQTFTTLAPMVFLRAADALHLACAREAGFREVHTNDRHMLAAAPHFGMNGVNVIPARVP